MIRSTGGERFRRTGPRPDSMPTAASATSGARRSRRAGAGPKGPSLDPATNRLAMAVEDHPLAYADFEGVIPAGEYGGGTVMLWDEGTWAPVPGKSWKNIDKGHLHFTLE